MSNCQFPENALQNTKNVQHNSISLNTLTNCIFLFMFHLTSSFDLYVHIFQHPLHKRMRELIIIILIKKIQ